MPKLIIGALRVQPISKPSGGKSFILVQADGAVHRDADSFLRCYEGSGTQRTYAYLLVDHLRWLERECLTTEGIELRDLERYMGLLGAEFYMPLGTPWREGKRPFGNAALTTMAACLKKFYLHLLERGRCREELGRRLSVSRLPTRADRSRSLLGHTTTAMPANPLAPKRHLRRHPKLPPEGARAQVMDALRTARDRMIVTWLADGGFRVGGLAGLHLVDLHLRENAPCLDCKAPHVHVCQRIGNPNGALAKSKRPWTVEEDVVCGGIIVRVSAAMIHTYFDYMTTEYPTTADHGMLLVSLTGPRTGQPLTTVGVRRMLERAGRRADLGKLLPHAFRHQFTNDVLDAADGDLLIARDAGGWASAVTIDEYYAHPDVNSPAFNSALRDVWGEQ